ncbi:MAG: hypothetical protein SFX18_17505 [Pirellulales bacterium]|nr:hypothetical protein [Pirellulales bacterium]
MIQRDTSNPRKPKDECGLFECVDAHEQHHIDQSQVLCKDQADCSKIQGGCYLLAWRCDPMMPNYPECYANAIDFDCVGNKALEFKKKKNDKCIKNGIGKSL